MQTFSRVVVGLVISLSFVAASCSLPLVNNTTGGVLKTANGGVDWQQSSKVVLDGKTGVVPGSVSKMAFGVNSPDVILAGTFTGGLYQSTDGGQVWTPILQKLTVYDFAQHPADANTLYVAGSFDNRGRVLVTRDDGKSWLEVFNEGSANNAVRAIAVNPNNAQEVTIGLQSGNIVQSLDGGTSWKLLQTYNDQVSRLEWHGGSLFAVMKTTGVLRSSDGGLSFQNITKSLQPSGNVLNFSFSGQTVGQFNRIAVSNTNSNLMFVTTDRGVFRTSDGGNNWAALALPLKQQNVVVQSVAVSPSTDSVVYVGAGNNVYKSVDGGNRWLVQDTTAEGLVNNVIVHPTLPQVAFVGMFVQ
jgi:photosystem II stability/assembly factor-like uncharacterized protein